MLDIPSLVYDLKTVQEQLREYKYKGRISKEERKVWDYLRLYCTALIAVRVGLKGKVHCVETPVLSRMTKEVRKNYTVGWVYNSMSTRRSKYLLWNRKRSELQV